MFKDLLDFPCNLQIICVMKLFLFYVYINVPVQLA